MLRYADEFEVRPKLCNVVTLTVMLQLIRGVCMEVVISALWNARKMDLPHVMIANDEMSEKGVPYVIHNIGACTRAKETRFYLSIDRPLSVNKPLSVNRHSNRVDL